MHDSRSVRSLDSVGVVGEGFVRSPAFEWLSRAGVVARGMCSVC